MSTGKLVEERGSDYGHPKEDFGRTAKLWSAIKGIEFTADDVALFMICVKLSREVHKHKLDNLDDIQGYAETKKMLHE
jgi:hypothetical protein